MAWPACSAETSPRPKLFRCASTPSSTRCRSKSPQSRSDAMRVSPEVEVAFGLAASEAERRRHEFMTVEHLLFALLFDGDCARIIRHAGGDVEAIRRKLDRYLDHDVPKLPDSVEVTPSPTVGFQRVVQRAAIHVRSAGKDEVRGRNILVAIFA